MRIFAAWTRTFAIRDATFDDLQAILDIYNAEVVSGTATWDTEERSWEAQLQWWEAHATPYCVIVAVEADGTVVGWGSLSRFHPRSGYRFTVEDTVYVRPDRQRRGIGEAILSHLDHARAGRRASARCWARFQATTRQHRAAPRLRFLRGGPGARAGLQVRPLARRRDDAASAGAEAGAVEESA